MDIAPIRGTTTVFGDFVSADVMLPARHSFLAPQQMAENVLLDMGPEANMKVRSHQVVIAGEAFGYGTGRESPSRALRAAGIRVVIAKSFSRLFFRNAINNGILVLQCPELCSEKIGEGDEIEVDLTHGVIHWNGRQFRVPPVAPAVARIIAAGDLIAYGRELLRA